jgi:ubiquitin-activating enzyme E1
VQYADDSDAGVDTEALGDALRRVVGTLATRPASYKQCVRKALCLFAERFDAAIGHILQQFPAAHRDEDGLPFWRGSKRMPVRLPFAPNDPSHVAFVRAAARLFAEAYGVSAAGAPPVSDASFGAALEAALLEQESDAVAAKASGKDPTPTPAATTGASSEEGDDDDEASLARLMAEAEALLARADELRAAVPADSLRPLEFEKDDDGNGHVDFILAASNLRAHNYAIATVDRLACKGLAGRIVPAIATTTAVVASLVCFELLKLARAAAERAAGCPPDAMLERTRLRSTFVNLALPLVASTEPLPPTPRALGIGGLEALSEWDELDLDLDAAGGVISGVVEQLERTLGGARVLALACGDTVLFSARLRCAFAPDERVAGALAKLRPPPYVHAAADGRREVRLTVTAVRAGDEMPIDAPPVVLRWRAGP